MGVDASSGSTNTSPAGRSGSENEVQRDDKGSGGGQDGHLAPVGEESPEAGPSQEENPHEGGGGLGHDGDPEQPEVIVVEEPEPKAEAPYKVVRVPRTPTQKEIDEHVATHLPHAEWCDVCMKGRGRNSPHRKKDEEEHPSNHDPNGTGSGPSGSEGTRVPKVSMD